MITAECNKYRGGEADKHTALLTFFLVDDEYEIITTLSINRTFTILDGTAYQQAELRRIEEEAAKVTGKGTEFKASTSGLGNKCACGYENETIAKFCAVCGSAL